MRLNPPLTRTGGIEHVAGSMVRCSKSSEPGQFDKFQAAQNGSIGVERVWYVSARGRDPETGLLIMKVHALGLQMSLWVTIGMHAHQIG